MFSDVYTYKETYIYSYIYIYIYFMSLYLRRNIKRIFALTLSRAIHGKKLNSADTRLPIHLVVI